MTEWDFAEKAFERIMQGGIAQVAAGAAVIAMIGLGVIQVSKAKWKPYTKLLQNIGKAMNAEAIGKMEDLQQSMKDIRKEMEEIKKQQEEKDIRDVRNRVLRFSDECRRHEKHSEEFFSQIIEDVDTYEAYCGKHPDFKNNKCREAVQVIKEAHQHALRENDFI